MVELLIKNRLLKLQQQYQTLKEEATKLMKKGDITNYIDTLAQADKVKRQLKYTAMIEASPSY